MYTFIPIAIIFILAIIFKIIINRRNKKVKKIEDLINTKTQQLEDLNNQIEELTYGKSLNLTKSQINALNIYEHSNIQIPVDILEELSHMRLSNTEEIIAFIENQRYYWKLENTKKPFTRK